MKNERRSYLLPALLILAGASISGYLLYRHFYLTFPSFGASADLCYVVFGKGCNGALTSPWANHWGIALAGWGLIYYVLLGFLLFLRHVMEEDFQAEALWGLFFLTLIGSCTSIFLLAVMLLNPLWFCPFCAVIHLINITLFLLFRQRVASPWTGLYAGFKSALRFLLWGKAQDVRITRWKAAGFGLVLVTGLAVYQWVRLQEIGLQYQSERTYEPDRSLISFMGTESDSVAIGDHSPVFGRPDAPAQLIVFSDFQCPACRKLAGSLSDLYRRFPDHLQIVFKHFPLSPVCNHELKDEIHPEACAAARAAIAASRQGKFWSYHDALFRTNLHNAGENSFVTIAADLGLDQERFLKDFHSEMVDQVLLSDIREGQRLDLEGTPALFLNGRRVSDLSLRNLRLLVAFASQPDR